MSLLMAKESKNRRRPLMSLVKKETRAFAGAMGKVSDAVQDNNSGIIQELSTNGNFSACIIKKSNIVN
jgi:hypothetical protein